MGMRSFSLCSVLAACVGVGLLSTSAGATTISVHWSNYGGNADSSITAITNPTGDGVVNSTSWNNLGATWGAVNGPSQALASNLLDSNSALSGVSVGVSAPGNGNMWWVTGPTAGVDNLLVGPWGGAQDDSTKKPSVAFPDKPIPNVIAGISYSSYEIIAYFNNPFGAENTVWLDGAPASSNAANAPVAGSVNYVLPDSNAFDLVPSGTTLASPGKGNYVIYSGLTGSNQTLWIGASNPTVDTNEAFTGFQIVDTSGVPEPASLSLLGAGALLLISRRRK